MASPFVSAAVLAAGKSTRMGQPKALLRVQGETWLGRILGALKRSRASEVLVVLGHRAEDVRPLATQCGARVVVNPRYEEGMLSSVHAALAEVDPRAEGLLLCLVDNPLLSSDLVDRLIEAFASSGAPLVIPTFQGRRGHPTLFGRALFAELAAAPPTVGARAVVQGRLSEACLLPVEDRSVLLNLNDPGDYALVLQTLGEAVPRPERGP